MNTILSAKALSAEVAEVIDARPGIVLARADNGGWDGTMNLLFAAAATDLLSDGPVSDVTIISGIASNGFDIDNATLVDYYQGVLTFTRDEDTELRFDVDEVQALIVHS